MQRRRRQGSTQELAATDLRNFRTFLLMREFATREIGERIAQARREAGAMTQEALAEALNVSKRSLQDYEAGKTIPWKHFKRLEQIFDRTLDWFIRGEEPPEQTQNLTEVTGQLIDAAATIQTAAESLSRSAEKLEALAARPPARAEKRPS